MNLSWRICLSADAALNGPLVIQLLWQSPKPLLDSWAAAAGVTAWAICLIALLGPPLPQALLWLCRGRGWRWPFSRPTLLGSESSRSIFLRLYDSTIPPYTDSRKRSELMADAYYRLLAGVVVLLLDLVKQALGA